MNAKWGAVETRYISRYMRFQQDGLAYYHELTGPELEGMVRRPWRQGLRELTTLYSKRA
jgi:hypothetical protein